MALIHKGQTLRHKTEPDWPTVTVNSVHETDLPSFAGNRVPPFAWVTWADKPGESAVIYLATLQRDWEDTGV